MALKSAAALRKDLTNAKGATFEHRHFAALADMLASEREHHTPDAWAALLARFADYLAGTNQKFDKARFLAACTASRL